MIQLEYPLQYERQKTRVVTIGDLKIGGTHPILIQSMLSSATTNVTSCILEIKELNAVGCQLIRLTVPSRKDLESILELRRIMVEEGLNIPLVADIHFLPELALDACEFFEKIRISQ